MREDVYVCFLLVVRIIHRFLLMASTSETIKLIIRTANNKYADFELELSLLANVYDLKQKITLNHPTKPVSIRDK